MQHEQNPSFKGKEKVDINIEIQKKSVKGFSLVKIQLARKNKIPTFPSISLLQSTCINLGIRKRFCYKKDKENKDILG